MDVGIADTVWVLFSTVLWLGLAASAATMAVARHQPPVLWFVLSLFAPVLTLLALLVFFERDRGVGPSELTLLEAAGHHPVARALAANPERTTEALARELSLSVPAVAGDLKTLRRLGLAREAAHRWSLTADGRAALRATEAAGADRSDAT